jgi:hypothetical protein
LPDRILPFIARPDGGFVSGIEGEAGGLQGSGDPVTQVFELAPQRATADRRCRARHDLEIHVFRHALDNAVRPGEGRSAAEDEIKWRAVECSQNADRPHDVKIFRHGRRARQPEEIRDRAQILGQVTAQTSAPWCCSGACG